MPPDTVAGDLGWGLPTQFRVWPDRVVIAPLGDQAEPAMGQRSQQRLVEALVAQPQPLGGERFYAICPLTGQRCTVLILPAGETLFASVRGWGVPYSSTREREVSRAVRTMRKIEGQKMSKYARMPTREQQWRRWMKAADIYDAWEEGLMQYW
jgi:hypothetical protein